MTDIDVIKQIETELNIRLLQVDKPGQQINSYFLDQNKQVVGLSLYHVQGKNLDNVLHLVKSLSNLTYLSSVLNYHPDLSFLSGLKNLKELDLGFNKIKNISSLKSLTNLTKLVLDGNPITNFSPLSELQSLEELGLYGIELNDISSLVNILKATPNLTGLDLAKNKIRNISPLKALPHLTKLRLSENPVADTAVLKELQNLENLDLDKIKIDTISFLESLHNLTSIDVGGHHLKNQEIAILKNLPKLTSLSLSDCKINDLSWLKSMSRLTGLDLGANQLSDISPLKLLPNLKDLDLYENQIVDISPLGNLQGLRYLQLAGNQIENISSLTTLNKLETLWLLNNKISDIRYLQDLINLTGLSVGENQVSDISALRNLKKCTRLDLQDNQISSIQSLQDLRLLSHLNLSNNQISDISPLRNLRRLSLLDLQNNPIVELPPWITDFDMRIQWEKYGVDEGYITFFDNPLKSPPQEIVQQGKEAVKNYFEQLREQSEDYLFEAKMLIVGEPGAGKTTLAWKVENPNCEMPEEKDTTKGIDVKQYYFPLQRNDFSSFGHLEKLEGKNFRLNLWDFGGQQIYKATHRFFLSKRSLYVLVADSRNEDTDFNYWLNIVEMFGGNSPLLIVLNEKYQRKRNLDIAAMRNRFTNISEVIDVDFAEDEKSRLYRLQKAIKYYVSQLPHIGSPVPAKWTIVRETLENDLRNTISVQDYMKTCQDNGITKTKDALVLSQYFHDIGVFLHFQDDELLAKTIFLKPNWATNAVYKILDHELLSQNSGRFNKADAKEIWAEDEYEFVRDELLKLMQKFFLTYEIEDTGEYIVPERLPQTQPKFSWDERENLILQYKYDLFMPKGIMSQFIVQTNRYITNHDYVWGRGVVLEREDTKAEVIESYDSRNIKIRIHGKHKRDFMTIITEQLDRINSQFEKMKVEKLIPCNCNECKNESAPHFFEYEDLRRRLEKGKQDVECSKSYQIVSVRSLIDEVLNENILNSAERKVISQPVNVLSDKTGRNKVFISYSHKDADWLKKVQTHLKVLENLGMPINLWDDTQIKPGMKWREEIKNALSVTKVAILLISPDFLASDFISKDELPPLLKAAEQDGATILPVIVRPSLYTNHPKLKEYQAANDPSRPLSKLNKSEQDEILVAFSQRVMELMKRSK